MSGHSKWNNIKNKKEKSDAQRAKIFTKLGREIAVIVKLGGPNPDSNGKLRDAIAKARSNNMPNDNIARCIAKAAGETGGNDYEEITYEGYGPKGVAVIVETLTNNRISMVILMKELILLLIIGTCLSVDAFSVSTVIGMYDLSSKKILQTSLTVGIFHFIMPLIGYIFSYQIQMFVLE